MIILLSLNVRKILIIDIFSKNNTLSSKFSFPQINSMKNDNGLIILSGTNLKNVISVILQNDLSKKDADNTIQFQYPSDFTTPSYLMLVEMVNGIKTAINVNPEIVTF